MKKAIIISGILGAIMILGLLMFFGGSGDSGSAPVPVEEDYCYYYQYTAYKLGVDWEICLIIDMFNAQKDGTTMEEQNYLITSLNFVKLKEDIYSESTEDHEDGSTTTTYIYQGTNYYTGAAEILAHLGISQNEKGVDAIISAVDSKQDKEHKYFFEQEADKQEVVNSYYSHFTEEQKLNIMQLYDYHYYASIYGNQFGVVGEDVYLSDLIGDMDFAPNGMSIPLFKQYDPQWGSVSFGGGNITTSGCSVTSMAMVFSYLLDETIIPPTIVAWTGNRYYVHPAGQSWGIFAACASQWGLTCKDLGKNSTAVVNALSEGKPVIASMAPGTFTKGGHFIVLRGITEDGKILVNDPNDNASKNFVNRQFDLSLIMRESKNFWSFSK